MTKTQTIELLQQQLPGFYSVEQVINMINDIEDSDESAKTVTRLTQEQIQEIAENAASSVASEGRDLVEDYDLCMSYREVELDNLSLDESRIASEIERAITDWLNNNKIEVN